MTPFILFTAASMGLFNGVVVWLFIRMNKFAFQPQDIRTSLEQFWLIAHDPRHFIWALIPAVIGSSTFLVTTLAGLDLFEGVKRKKRGAQLVSASVLKKLTKERKKSVKQITVGDVPIPVWTETSHLLLVGSTGTGKSNGQNEILQAAISRGDRVIIVDPDGQSLSKYWKEDDRILNPFDTRGEKWSAFGEIQRESDFDRVAFAMIPCSQGDDETWRARARTMLSELMQAMSTSGEEVTPSRLMWWVSEASRADLAPMLHGRSSAALLQPDAGKFLDSVRGVLSEYIRPHQRHPSGSFTLHNWIKREKGNLFLTWRDDQLRTLRPLITCWLDLLVSSTLSNESQDRPMWIFIDELGSLEQLGGLEAALTKGRKHGIRVVACLQSTSQLIDIYGKSKSETLRSCFRNLLVLGGSATDPDTAEALSRGLGESETEEREVSIARTGPRRSTTESKQVRKSRLVLPSEIQSLPVNTGYLKLAGEFPVASITVKPPKTANRTAAFKDK